MQTGTIKPPEGDRLVRTIDRVISKSGVGSRTEARGWIREGRAAVNGVVVRDPDQWLDVARDRVTLDGRPLAKPKPAYLVLYKPRGYLTTYDDRDDRPTVFDLLPAEERYLFPVGRLDLDTSGLLLLTNDSTFAERLTNPDFKVPKTYQVKASTHLEDAQLEQLRNGIELNDGPTRPAMVTRVREAGGKTVFEITITEGRNRQVRRMVEALGATVLKLVRIAIGPLRIGEQPIGTVRPLTPEELQAFGFGRPKKTAASRAAKPRWRKR